MSLSYTTGNPNNLTGGASASMNDIQGPFVDIKTFLADGSGAVNDTILTSPNNAVWDPLFAARSVIFAGTTVGTYYFASSGLVTNSGATSTPPSLWMPIAADVAVNSKTTRLRLSVVTAVNGVPPAINFTFGYYPVTAIGNTTSGTAAYTLGTVIAGSTVAVNAPGTGPARNVSSSFDLTSLSAGTLYLPGVVLSGTAAANSGVHCVATLEQRHT